MEQIKSYSPDYSKKKFNNYDNFVKNSQRVVHEQFEMDKNIKVPNPQHLVSNEPIHLLICFLILAKGV